MAAVKISMMLPKRTDLRSIAPKRVTAALMKRESTIQTHRYRAMRRLKAMADEWDGNDEIISFELSTDDDSYYVEKNALWYELVDLCDTHVEVTGMVTEEKDGTKRILVTDYEPLEDMDSDDDEVEYDDFYEELSFENEGDELRC